MPPSDAPKILPQFAFVAAVIVIGAGVVWWSRSGGDGSRPAPASSPAPVPPHAASGPAAPPRVVAFDLLDDWRFPDGAYALETTGLERAGYRSKTPPDEIAALDGVRIAVDGFVQAVGLDAGGRITSAFLLRHQSGCGYGKSPTPSQRIAVTVLPGAPIDLRSGQAARAVGVLRVNAKPEGDFPALYSMEVESLRFTTGYDPDAAELASGEDGDSGDSGDSGSSGD